MDDALTHASPEVIPVWGLLPDECVKIIALAQKLIRQGRASDIKEKRHRAYLCVYDRLGAPYTITREQRLLTLLSPSGETIVISKNLEAIIDALHDSLQHYS